MKRKTRKRKHERGGLAVKRWGLQVHVFSIHKSTAYLLVLQKHQPKQWGLLLSVTTKVVTRGW